MSRSLLFLLALGIFFAPSSISPADSADPQPFFGPRIYSRSPGAPRLESDHFKNCEPAARYRLIVENGAPGGRVSSASIVLNGIEVVAESDFNQNVSRIETAATLLGENEVSVTLRSRPGSSLSVSVVCVENCLSIAILDASASGRSGAARLVEGIINSSSDEVGVTVNGIGADVRGGRFLADVPLTDGENKLVAVASDPCSTTATDSLTVNVVRPSDPIPRITINPASGAVPLAVHFAADLASLFSAISWDFGDGTSLGEGVAVDHRYEEAGLYQVRMSALGGGGERIELSGGVLVETVGEIDSLLRRRWTKLVGDLSSGSLEEALGAILHDSQPRYRKVWTALLPHIPEVIGGFGEIHLNSVGSDGAEYYMVKQEGADRFGYFIYFVRDERGLWKIESM